MRMRVSYLEDTCRELGRTVQQLSDVIQYRLHRPEPTYCSQPSSVEPTFSQSLALPKTISTDSTHDPLPDGESYTRNMSARHNEHAPSTCVPHQKSVIVPSAAPTDCDGFTVPSHVLNKRRKQARRKRKIITGSNTGDQTLKGANQDANRDLFVYHVDKSATTEDLEHLMTSQKCEVRKVSVTSNDEARFKSFKLTIPASCLKRVFSEEFPWPLNVRVRRFISRRPQDHVRRSQQQDQQHI
ncbi:hypothetical protein CAPTEDRAFT_207510 [Capitella teleta]|uniref:Uncharacterized protein n=1 Tax=Capitella teleta TaxID=283909 RepID=R7UBK2_CAPTE|nr:hypothetical protein CAPTEDRAFT_207510 [Capitella teleta]|eukprot:ELU00647.1 hypothetical protein CAPTEDRAFT_207510 [Capitella teleta]